MSKRFVFGFLLLFLSLYFVGTWVWILSTPHEGIFESKGNIFKGKFHSAMLDLPFWQPSVQNISAFPFSQYQTSIVEKGFPELEADIQILNTKYPTYENAGQEILFYALGDSLLPHISTLFKTYQPDSLLLLLEWAERFRGYAEAAPQHALAYSSVYHFWMQQIATALDRFGNEDPSRKVRFKFRYLAERCGRNEFYINIKETRIEKFRKNLLAGNWSHLIGASWHDASGMLKAFFVFFPLLTAIAYLQWIYSLVQKFSKRKK